VPLRSQWLKIANFRHDRATTGNNQSAISRAAPDGSGRGKRLPGDSHLPGSSLRSCLAPRPQFYRGYLAASRSKSQKDNMPPIISADQVCEREWVRLGERSTVMLVISLLLAREMRRDASAEQELTLGFDDLLADTTFDLKREEVDQIRSHARTHFAVMIASARASGHETEEELTNAGLPKPKSTWEQLFGKWWRSRVQT
jgi:hypothetical protein